MDTYCYDRKLNRYILSLEKGYEQKIITLGIINLRLVGISQGHCLQ